MGAGHFHKLSQTMHTESEAHAAADNQSTSQRDATNAANLQAFIPIYQQMIADVPEGQKDPVELQMVNNSLHIWNDPRKAALYTLESSHRGATDKYKCNIFVSDVATMSGGQPAPVSWTKWGIPRPNRFPMAGEWADMTNTEIGRYYPVTTYDTLVKETSSSRAHMQTTNLPIDVNYFTYGGKLPGDIISFGPPTASPAQDHTGINLYGGLYISATDPSYGQENVVIKGSPAVDRYNPQVYRAPYSNDQPSIRSDMIYAEPSGGYDEFYPLGTYTDPMSIDMSTIRLVNPGVFDPTNIGMNPGYIDTNPGETYIQVRKKTKGGL